MTLKELTSDIAGLKNRELDFVFKRQIETRIISAYAEVVRQYIDNHKSVPQGFIKQINCEATEEADIAECCSIRLECNVTKTVNEIPEPIGAKGVSSNFTYVGAINSKEPFTFIQPDELDGILAERFHYNGIYYTYINRKIYLFNGTVKNVRLRGAFPDIREIAKLNDCENTPAGCGNTLVIPDDAVERIKSFVLRQIGIVEPSREKEEIEIEDTENG